MQRGISSLISKTRLRIIKHTNPAGSVLETRAEAYTKAWRPIRFRRLAESWRSIALSTRGGQEVVKIFTEVVIAPEYDAAALEICNEEKPCACFA
jgi:AICAR transformylase/IMP cyclohydrolase PurH